MSKSQLYLWAVIFISIVVALWEVVCFKLQDRIRKITERHSLKQWALVAILIRVLFVTVWSINPKANSSDMSYWIDWITFLKNHSISDYYTYGVGDYVPVFVYYLKAVSRVITWTGVSDDGLATQFLVKAWPIVFDIIGGILLSKLADSNEHAVLYWFNPAVIIISTIWGQIDSSYAALILLVVVMIKQKKWILAYAILLVSTLLKLQTIFSFPVFGIVAIIYMLDKRIRIRDRILNACVSLVTIGIIGAILLLPCGIQSVFRQSITTTGQYPVATLNAPNIWALFGLNSVSQDYVILGFSVRIWGTLFLILITVTMVLITIRYRCNKEIMLYSTAGMFFMVFMLAVRMHERYAFPVILLTLAIYGSKKGKIIPAWYYIFTTTCFINYCSVLALASMPKQQNIIIVLLSGVNIILAIDYIWYMISSLKKEKEE